MKVREFILIVCIHSLSEYMISSFIKCELQFIMSNLYRPYFAITSTVKGSSVHILSIRDVFSAPGEMLCDIFTQSMSKINNYVTFRLCISKKKKKNMSALH